VGWSEGGWHEPWCYAGKCYTGKYDRCDDPEHEDDRQRLDARFAAGTMKEGTFGLGDGTWCFKGPGTSGKWRRDTECPVRREESEARGQVCRGGDRGAGGRCDCTGAVGWSEGGWHEPWCYAGKCYTGKYDRCDDPEHEDDRQRLDARFAAGTMKEGTFGLGDGTWCFKGPGTSGKWRRDTECPVRREEPKERGRTGAANSLSGHYFSFRTGGNPGDVVDRFEARQTGDRVTYYRNGPVGSKSRVESASAIPMESYSIEGTTLRGVVTGTVLQNGDIEYSHGYTSRKEADSTPSVEHEKPEEDVCSKFEAMPVVLKGCRSCQEHFPKNVDACLGCGKYCYEQNCEGMDVEKCIATDAFKQCDMGCLKKKIPHAFEKPSLVV